MLVLATAGTSVAQSASLAEPLGVRPGPDFRAQRDAASVEQRFVPERYARVDTPFWDVGVAVERFGDGQEEGRSGQNLYGVAATWRLGPFGPHALIMSSVSDSYENIRALGGLGLRAYFDVPGLTTFSYGVGGHVEIRLEDHYWLGYVTPVEVGATVYSKGSWDVQLFLGVRRAAAGRLIDNFLIDPNGVRNAEASEDLHQARHVRPWKGFVRIVFARRID